MSQKYLVPIQLPANPTAALEAATKQYVDAMPRGLVAVKRGVVAGSALSSVPLTIYNISFAMTAGRAYELSVGARAISTSGSTPPGVHLATTWDVTPPGPAIDAWFYAPGQWSSIHWTWIVQPTVTQTYNLQIKADVSNGSGVLHNTSAQIAIKDIGAAVTET